MKVLIPATHYYPVIGGIETWTRNIAEQLTAMAEVFVVTGKVKDQSQQEEASGVKIWRTSFFTLANLSASPLIFTISSLPFIFFKSLALIKKEKIDVVHCQGFLSSVLGFLLFKLTGAPYVVTVQRLESKSNPFKNFIYRQAAVCIGASRAIGQYFKEIGCKNIEVIPNGIDLEKFENLERKPHAGFVVMTVARLEMVKGIKYLIEAAARSELQRRSYLLILIIGDGSEKRSLEGLVEKLGLKDKVRFLGEIPNEQIPSYLATADCFVLPSLKEGFGIVILEAQAAGIPVIGTKVGGILDLIKDGQTGILVEPGNSEDISRAISRVYADSEFSRSLVKNAKIELTKYSWQNIAEKVYSEYDSIYRAIKSPAMKLIFATGIFPPDIGGPATYVERLATEFHRQGFLVQVITYSNVKDKEYDFPVTRISRKWPAGMRHFVYFLKLFKLAKNCDVIYAQNITSAGFPSLLAAKLMRKKLILKIVGDAAWEQNKGYLKPVQEAVARFASKIIVPSLYLKKRVMGWGIPGEKIEVIYNAPEPVFILDIPKAEAKEKLGLSGNIILSVGRFAPWKGFAELIDVMPALLKENSAFQLVIVGDGGERKNLELKIKNLELGDKVKLTGSVPHSQMPLYFKAADMFVLNSGYEGLSHVILEAMQHGAPVIASSEGGNPEVIEDNVNGFLVEYKNQEQLKNAILKLWQDKILQEKFIQNSREKLKGFTWDILVEKTTKILERY